MTFPGGGGDEGERFWGSSPPETVGGRRQRRVQRRRRWVAIGVAVSVATVGLATVVPKALGHGPRTAANLPALTSARRHRALTPSTAEPTNLSGTRPDFSHPPPLNGDVAAANAKARAKAAKGAGFNPKLSKLVSENATTDTYRNQDGSFTKQVHLVPINYQDSVGKWRPIDTSLVRTRGGGLGTKASPLTVRLAPSTTGATPAAARHGRHGLDVQLVDAADLVTVSAASWSVGFSMEGAQPSQVQLVTPALPNPPDDPRPAGPVPPPPDGASPTPPAGAQPLPGKATTTPGTLDDQIASYGQVAPGVNLSYATAPEQLQEDIELTTPPTTPPVFTFPLDLNGVVPRTSLDGTIQFVDPTGNVEASIDQGVMNDSAPSNRGSNPGQVATTLESSDGGYELVMTPDAAWLADPSRVYPVHIDPSIYAGWQTPSTDGIVSSASPTTPCSGACQYCCYGEVYLDNVGLGWYYVYFYANTYEMFNLGLGTLPNPNIDILSANWEAWFTTGDNSSPAYMYPANPGWNASTITWNNQAGFNTSVGYVALTDVPTSGGTSVPITSWVQGWVNGTIPYGGLVFDSPGGWVRFLAADSTVPYEEPVLAFTYDTIPPPSPQVSPTN